jgi:PAS domain-containing protein
LGRQPELNGNEARDLLALLVQAVDKANQGLVVCNKKGRVVLRNAPARELVNARDGDFLPRRQSKLRWGGRSRALTTRRLSTFTPPPGTP